MNVSRPRLSTFISSAFIFSTLTGLLIGFLVVGCQTAPVTERRQLLMMSSERENAMGLTAYQEVLQDEPLTKDEQMVEMVRRVGKRIAAVADRPDFNWEFNVIESETQNAFCLPGGKVAVYTGILPVCQTEAGLAVVMSHEIGHAIARHGGERMSLQTVQNTARDALKYVMLEKDDDTQMIILAAYGVLLPPRTGRRLLSFFRLIRPMHEDPLRFVNCCLKRWTCISGLQRRLVPARPSQRLFRSASDRFTASRRRRRRRTYFLQAGLFPE